MTDHTLELFQVIDDLPLRYTLEVKIKGKGNGLGAVLHPAESLIDYKGVVAGVADKALGCAIMGLPASPFPDVFRLADRAGDLRLCRFNLSWRALFLNITREFK